MLKLRGVEKSYNKGKNSLKVLKGINLDVAEGEFVSILGASGSGKSTLMNIIGCMDSMDSGEYHFGGESVHTKNSEQLARLRNENIGFVFQKYQLIPQYTVVQNVIMPLLISGMSRHRAVKHCEDKIRAAGLWERRTHRPAELSGGEQQRVAIVRALVTKPKLLLADEPTGALDSATGKEILGMFKDLNKDGNTIIMITHDIFVAGNASRIVRISDGSVGE